MIQWPDLRAVLQGIPWVVVGGVGTRAYMPERMTKDFDILVAKPDGDKVIQRLREAGYTLVTELAVPGYLLQSPEGVEVDVLFGDMEWVDEALQQPRYDLAGFPVLDLPYLVLMKMSAMRAQDWADVSRMLGLATEEMLNRVRQVVKQYSPADCEDLESLIFIGKKELDLPASGV